jgi:hypothetical protein
LAASTDEDTDRDSIRLPHPSAKRRHGDQLCVRLPLSPDSSRLL